MKKYFVFVSIFLTLNSFGQYKQETIDFLNMKMYGSAFAEGMFESEETRFTTINNDGTFEIKAYRKGKWEKERELVNVFSGSFRDFAPNTFLIQELEGANKGLFLIKVDCYDSDCVKQHNIYEGEIFSNNGTAFNYETSRENCERYVKAMKHLCKIMGAKHSPF